jgi:hypothetical protein
LGGGEGREGLDLYELVLYIAANVVKRGLTDVMINY